MAAGDANDFAVRFAAVVPARWFGSTTPVLTGILTGFGAIFAAIYSQIAYTILQTRIATATDGFLDAISQDFFGGVLPRFIGETDAAFSARIRANFFLPKNIRAALVSALTRLTGRAPWIFDPRNTGDAGAYNNGHLAYSTAGGYGNLNLPFQFFIKPYRPHTGGIPVVAGYSGNLSSPEYCPGGYGVGAIKYGTNVLEITDAAILNTIVQTIPAATIAWTAITN